MTVVNDPHRKLAAPADGDQSFVRTEILMDTCVRIVVPGGSPEQCGETVERAFQWFRAVEKVCSRFDEASEVMQLIHRPGAPQPVSPLLFEVIRFALEVAEASRGAFDPTVGSALEKRGINRNYRTGRIVQTALRTEGEVSYHDVHLAERSRMVTLRQPLILDFGAVAKGFALDLAARELAVLRNYAIDAGGDIFAAGTNGNGEPWRIGIRHPRSEGELLTALRISNLSVCTSGDYERSVEAGHHILDPRIGESSAAVCSVTVVAPTAMAADALGTAAFVLGLVDGVRFLQRQGADGLLVSRNLEEWATPGFRRYKIQ